MVVLAVGEGPEAEVVGDIDDLTISPSQIELIKTVHGVRLGPNQPIQRSTNLHPIAANLFSLCFWFCSLCGQAIAKSGRKVKSVMVLVEARPRIIPEELINATSAVINAYLPGPSTLWRREFFLPPRWFF